MTRNCQIYIIPLDTPKIGIYKLKDFMNCIKVKRNHLLSSIYSSVSPDFRFKETPYVNFFTDPELSSSLYIPFLDIKNMKCCDTNAGQCTQYVKLCTVCNNSYPHLLYSSKLHASIFNSIFNKGSL